MKKILIGLSILISILSLAKKNSSNDYIIPSDSIRLRIISNSTDELDIIKKNRLKDYIEDYLFDLVKDDLTKEEVKKDILENFDDINEKVASFLNSNNYKIDFGQNFFPKKIYKGVIYDEGMYDSLVITIGNGKGSNWWCVLFPPLCLIEENASVTDVEYQLFISRIINYYK